MFRSPFHDHLQGSFFVLSASTTYQPPALSFLFFGFVAVCPLFVVYPVYLSVCCLVVNDQTTHRQVHRTHIQIGKYCIAEGIRPQTPKKTNDEAGG
jgi:hypothetical protein